MGSIASAGSIYSVAQINSYIRNMFAQDYLLGKVSVRGEISNCKYHSSGHIYFTLKDESAAISCILFAGNRAQLTFRLADGMRVVAKGSIGVYEKGGTYQLYVRTVSPDGTGALYERFEALKKELEEMGMFDPSYKKPIPRYASCIGVVTAPTGAAVRDIIQISKRRNPGIRILLVPARVQGEGAVQSIVQGIHALEQQDVDVIIVGRGGGSIEDLWAFNEEETARAVFSCRVPIISAVGHETDTVITDYVADLRAPTPSAAAELAVADMRQVFENLRRQEEELGRLMREILRQSRKELEQRRLKLALFSPENRIHQMRMLLEEKEQRLREGMGRALMSARHRQQAAAAKLEALSPQARLEQGYAYVQFKGGDYRMVKSAASLREGEVLELIFSDGSADVKVL